MLREEKILYHVDKKGQGIEIGPSYRPVAPKKAGYQVHIIDHMSREQLIEKYEKHLAHLGNIDLKSIIEDVDFIWNGEPYSELVGKTKFYDWIIASHLIEHTPDLIGFLNDCDKIMKDDAVISLVIPDKRYCFDYFRPITGIAKIIDSHLQESTIHTPGTVTEFYLDGVSKAGKIAWKPGEEGDYSFRYTFKDARDEMDRVINEEKYIDVHAWCFTPHSFRLIIHDLYCLGFIPLKEVVFFPTTDGEFFITLGRKGKGIELDRLDVLKIIESELSADLGAAKQQASFLPSPRRLIRKLGQLLDRVLPPPEKDRQ